MSQATLGKLINCRTTLYTAVLDFIQADILVAACLVNICWRRSVTEREKEQKTIMNANRDQVLTSCPNVWPVILHVRIEQLKYFSNLFSSKQYSEL